MSEQTKIILLLENVRSLHNVGSLFRSADGAGVERLILCGLTPAPPRLEISKTALGAVETVPWEYLSDPIEALEKYPDYPAVALEQTDQSSDLYTTELIQQLILIVGHEREGVSIRTLAACHHVVHLPMHGQSAHSLNVSVAGALALYELRRRG